MKIPFISISIESDNHIWYIKIHHFTTPSKYFSVSDWLIKSHG